MITTRVHTVSSSTTAYTTAGIDVFEAGPTNFTISFSGADTTATYLKFLVNYPNDDKVYTITSPTDDVDKIRTQSISKTFYPDHDTYLTTYTIDISGLKNNLTTDRYRINLKLGRDPMTKYGDIKIVGSHLYTNDEGGNFCLLTLENETPRFISNVIVPFNKSSKVYAPAPTPPYIPNDDRILRTEMLTQIGGYVPICIEVTFNQVIREDQYQILTFGTENIYAPLGHTTQSLMRSHTEGYPARVFHKSNTHTVSAGEVSKGADIEDYIIIAPEDGIDYSIYQEDQADGLFANDDIINVTITDIYPGGVAS